MKKFMFLFLSILFMTGCTDGAEKLKLDYDKHLYEITDADGHCDYLLASLRMAEDKVYDISFELKNAFMESEEIVVEANPLEINLKMTQDQSYAFVNNMNENVDKELLDQFLSQSIYSRYDPNLYNACTVHGLVMMSYGYEVPFLALGATYYNSIDRYLASKAMDYEKKICEFESVDYQIELIQKLSKISPNYLIEQCLEKTKLENDAYLIRDAYQNGDTKTLYNYLAHYNSEKYQEEANHMKSILLDERNANFYEKISEYLLDDKKQLMLVGAVQLYGDEGVIQLLKENGYKVKLVKSA